jgi:2-methylcitrate dehydratase PrpD
MGGEAKLIKGLTTGRCAKVASMVDQPEGSCAVSEITARIADFVLRRAETLFPDGILRWASLQCLDTIGVTIAWGPMEAGRIARDAAVLLYGADSHAAQLLFDGRRVSMASAAFAAATQTDNLDGRDGYGPTKGHVGVAVVPALTAPAEAVSDLGRPEALAAIVIGYEIAGRAGIALHATVSDYHTSGTWNALGVAAMASRFIGLDDEKLRRTQMMREIATPIILHDGSGIGALVGLSAAVPAEHGFAGVPATTLEAADVAHHRDDLGIFWQMSRQYIKPYPVCRWAHAAIDGTRALCLEHRLGPEQVAMVRVINFHHAATLFAGMPDTTSKAQYSLAFAVATMHGRVGLEHISGAGLQDAAVAAMLRRVEVTESQRHSARFPQGRGADVRIETADGRVLDSGDVHARGGPEAPFAPEDIAAKYMELAAPARATAIRDSILRLATPGSRFIALAVLLYDPPAGQRRHAA